VTILDLKFEKSVEQTCAIFREITVLHTREKVDLLQRNVGGKTIKKRRVAGFRRCVNSQVRNSWSSGYALHVYQCPLQETETGTAGLGHVRESLDLCFIMKVTNIVLFGKLIILHFLSN